MTQMTPAAGRQLLGSVALVAASSKGDAAGLAFDAIAQEPGLEFLLVSRCGRPGCCAVKAWSD